MGYNFAAVQLLGQKVKALPKSASILEFGRQDLNPSIPDDVILACAKVIHDDDASARKAAGRYNSSTSCPVSELFRGSSYRYRCLDLFPGEFTIVADLNSFSVPPGDGGSFDLITNFGTTEHVADQINAFRVLHDYAGVGSLIIHSVPFSGYFNHGLFNYHPLFFVFLAAANNYKIEYLGLSPPHLPYSIPAISGLGGCENWVAKTIESGIVGCHLRKINDEPFRLFTDADRTMVDSFTVPEPWDQMLRDRYDLHVRPAALGQANFSQRDGDPARQVE
jgi:hypothetical protein